MSDSNPFIHTNSHITWAMPRLLEVLDKCKVIRGDSERAVAITCTPMLIGASKCLGRSVSRREDRVLSTIGEAINQGFVTYTPQEGLLIADKGREALKQWRDMCIKRSVKKPKAKKPNGRAHGRRKVALVN